MKDKTLFQLLKDFSSPELVISSPEIDQIKERINQCFLPNSEISDTGLKEFVTLDEKSHQTLKSFLMRILKAGNENIKQAIQATIIFINGNLKKTNQQLVQNLEIFKLAERYTDNFEIPLHVLLHLNQAIIFDEQDQTSQAQYDLAVTTFAHALVATKSINKICFFLRDMISQMSSELDFVRAYLTELYDSDQKSFIDRMKANGTFERLPENFRNHRLVRYILKMDDNIVPSIDTHQSSINKSVDASISRLLINFLQAHSFPMSTTNQDSKITIIFDRNEAFNQLISGYIDSFYNLLLSYSGSEALIEELVNCDITQSKDLKAKSEYLKFQINTVIRLVIDLKKGELGPNPHYTIDPTTYMRCGLNIVEILAISYHATQNVSDWKDHNNNQIMKYFISQLYRARRGYNIDNDDESETNYSSSVDKNKCADGTIHQIISGLLGNKDVEISIKTIETFKYSFYKRLPTIIEAIYQKDPKVIIDWYLTMSSTDNLTDRIINILLTDKELTDEYSAQELSSFTVKAIRSMSEQSIIDLIHKIDNNIIHQSKKNLKILRYHHNFGYIPYLEFLFRNNANRDELAECIYNEIQQNVFSPEDDSNKSFHYYEFLMQCPRSDFKEAFANIFKNAASKLIISSPSSNNPKVDDIRHIYRIAITNKDFIIGDLILDVILEKPFSDKIIHSVMNYAIEFQHNNAIHLIVKRLKNDYPKDILFIAIQHNNAYVFENFQNPTTINYIDIVNHTLIHQAVIHDRSTFISYLIDFHGFDPNALNITQQTPLHLAIQFKAIKSFLALLKIDKIQLNILDNFGYRAFDYAIAKIEFHAHINELITHKEFNVNSSNNYGQTPLHLVITNGKIQHLELLMKNPNILPNIQDSEGNTALHLSILSENLPFFIFLLSCDNIDHNIKNKKGDTPSLLAIKSKNELFLLNLIIQNKIDVNTINQSGNTLLHECVLKDYLTDFLKLLNYNNINPNIQDQNGNTPLHLIIQLNRIDFFGAIIEHPRLNINIQNSIGNTALHHSIIYPNKCYFNNLIDRSDTILDIQNIYKQTILHVAVENNLCHFIEKIIEKFQKEHYSITDEGRNTALQLAIREESLDIVKLLLPYSKDALTNPNRKKEIAIFMALECKLTDIFSYLCENCEYTILFLKNNNNQYLTHRAIELSNIDLLSIAIEWMTKKLEDHPLYKDSSLENRIQLVLAQRNEQRFNSLSFSIVVGDFDMFNWLLENYDFDLRKEDDLKRNLLHISAIYSDNVDFIRLLLNVDLNLLYKKDSSGLTPLCYSIIHRRYQVFTDLYSAYSHNDINGLIKLNIVHLLIKSNFPIYLIEQIIKICPESINNIDSEGNTSLLLAAQNDNLLVLDLLIQNNADVTVTNNKGKNIFHYIANKEMTPTTLKAMRENPTLLTAKDNNNECYLSMVVKHHNIIYIFRNLATFLTIDYGLFNEIKSLIDSQKSLLEYQSSQMSEIQKMLSIMLFNNKDILTNAKTTPEWIVVFDIINKFGILPEVSNNSQYYSKIQTIKSYENTIFASLISLIISENITEYLNNPEKIESIPTKSVCKIFAINALENPEFSEKFSSDFKRLATTIVREIKLSDAKSLSEQSIGPNTSLVIASRVLASNYATLNQEI